MKNPIKIRENSTLGYDYSSDGFKYYNNGQIMYMGVLQDCGFDEFVSHDDLDGPGFHGRKYIRRGVWEYYYKNGKIKSVGQFNRSGELKVEEGMNHPSFNYKSKNTFNVMDKNNIHTLLRYGEWLFFNEKSELIRKEIYSKKNIPMKIQMAQKFFRQEYVKTVIDVIKKKKYVTEIILFEETGKTSKGTIENTVDVSEIEKIKYNPKWKLCEDGFYEYCD